MSHRAIVVTPQSPDHGDEISLFHSKNGADQLRILPALNEFARRNVGEPVTWINDLPDDIATSIDDDLSHVGSDNVDAPRVDPNPVAENLERNSFAQEIDFIQYEAAFTVNLQSGVVDSPHAPVEVLLPVFVDVGILLFFSRFVRFEVYPRARLPDDFDAARSRIMDGEADPEFSLERMDYLHIQDNPDQFELLVDTHMGILQTLYSVSDLNDRDELLSMVVTEDDFVVGRIDTSSDVPLPNSAGAGILVRLPVTDIQYPQLVSLYNNWSHLAARLRLSHSFDSFVGFIDAIQQEATDEFDSTSYRTSLLEELATEFDESISPQTPDLFLEYF